MSLFRRKPDPALAAILEALKALQPSVMPPIPAAAILADTPLITDAQSIIRAEEAAARAERVKKVRERRLIGMPEDYQGPAPVAQGL